jgi:hypothetical protein
MDIDVRPLVIILVAEHPIDLVIGEVREAQLPSATEVHAQGTHKIVFFPGQGPSCEELS